jgi:hypothetical protein
MRGLKMVFKPVGVDENGHFPERVKTTLNATYVTFKNFDGTPVAGKHVEITLAADGADIDNIRVVTP